MEFWIWPATAGVLCAALGLVRYVLWLAFLWKVYDRGGRHDLAVAGQVTKPTAAAPENIGQAMRSVRVMRRSTVPAVSASAVPTLNESAS